MQECWMSEQQEEDNSYGGNQRLRNPSPTPLEGNNKGRMTKQLRISHEGK